MNPIRILLLLVDPDVLEKFRGILEPEEDMQITAATSDREDGLRLAAQHQPDLILLDFQLLDSPGAALISQVRRASQAKIVIVRSRKDPLIWRDFLLSSVAGVIDKEETPRWVLQAVRRTANSESGWMSLINHLEFDGWVRGKSFQPYQIPDFSPRELDVLRLLVDGKSVQEVGALLGISEQTVAKYQYAIYSKLMFGSHAL